MSDQSQETNTFRRDIKQLQEKSENQENRIEELEKKVAALIRKCGN